MCRKQIISTLYLVFIVGAYITDGAVYRHGNTIVSSADGPDYIRTTFLIDGEIQQEGVLFALAGYFRNKNPMKFQLWDPLSNNNSSLRLVHEWIIEPIVGMAREDIYLHINKRFDCVYVQKGYRVGIYIPEAPGCVAYKFNTTDPSMQTYSVPNGQSEPVPGDVVTFNALAYPYKLSAAVYVDTDLGRYPDKTNVSCPSSLTIPAEAGPGSSNSGSDQPNNNGLPGPEGPMGATGATGPRGSRGSQGERGQGGIQGIPGIQGVVGPQGSTGPAGPAGGTGATGPSGPAGTAGSQGERGEKGDKGDSGLPGPAGPAGESKEPQFEKLVAGCSWCPTFLNPYLVMGLLIWLALVTLILFVFLLVYCCRTNKKSPENNYARNIAASSQNDLWKRYNENGGYEKELDPDENMYSAIEEGGRLPEGRTEL